MTTLQRKRKPNKTIKKVGTKVSTFFVGVSCIGFCLYLSALSLLAGKYDYESEIDSQYELQGKVISCNRIETLIETLDGNIWSCTDKIQSGTEVCVTLDNMGTMRQTDDVILSVYKY